MSSTTLGQILFPSSTDESSILVSAYTQRNEAMGAAIVTTTRHSTYMGHGEATVSPVITLIILVAGVVGGLFIVVCVILFCKYCVKTKKTFRRHPGYGRDRVMVERRFHLLQRYETINSDLFSEPSSVSVDGVPLSPRRLFDSSKSHDRVSESEEADHTTKLKSDVDKAQQQSQDLETEVFKSLSEENDDQVPNGGRRVSFQLDNLPTSSTNKLRRSRRYTEGDFHHLKRSKIDKSVPRQYSLGARTWVDEAALRASIEEQLRKVEEKARRESLPILDLNSSLSPTLKPIRTQVAVEIHHQQTINKLDERKGVQEAGEFRKDLRPHPPQSLRTSPAQKYSHSLETVSPTTQKMYRETRKVKSYEDFADYDVLKITEFSKGPFYNTDYDVISELGSPMSSKVRYNDTGSLEQLNEEQVVYLNDLDLEGIMPEESDDTETLNGTQKYRELWNLRATLEDEDECSDTIRMEDMTSPEESPEHEQITPYTTSFESNTEAPSDVGVGDQRDNSIQWEGAGRTSSKNLLHPNYENRRQNYRNILTKRLQKAGPNTSTENSFDSVETDGDVSDTSRYEVTTTSFESTTDNTDSTTESQQSKLRQMKADSGYKSLETQGSTKENADVEKDTSPGAPCLENSPPKSPLKSLHKSQEKPTQTSTVQDLKPGSLGSPKHTQKRSGHASHFDRRNGKTASKKRRAYSRERQMVRVYESINEPETDSKSELASGDSFEDNTVPSKISVFKRFFKSHSLETREKYLSRDYSIDETTNKIFNDFIRQEPHDTRLGARRSPRLHYRHRLHRKHTEPVIGDDRRRDRLAPDMRSTSLGSDSSASSVRRLSPQDSIEEEDFEEEQSVAWSCRDRQFSPDDLNQQQAIHGIPIIRLPEEEAEDL
ncbi:serine-rich adhesin for platelets-like isoform X2 [Haliotis cracherodii]|uniref:serine-rich adhesin for platelets-like isoform X2 n=1 Tax=Haliotis cracherodii TaxID=6455 RepID=UPI0039EA0EC6